MLIRRPAHHDRIPGTRREDAVAFEPFDRQHVIEKFPQSNAEIANRLGAAISRRRAYLRHRDRHHAKLGKGINQIEDDKTELSETIATEFDGSHFDLDQTEIESSASQTSYATTLLEGRGTMTVPSPPKDSANGQPFECPYCFFITTVKDSRSWARHVFKDIMPYVCIFTDCSTPNQLYDSRRDWYRHLVNKHHEWANADAPTDCPLCQEISLPRPKLERHLGRHLEELALFALPRTISPLGAGQATSSRAGSENNRLQDDDDQADSRSVSGSSRSKSQSRDMTPTNIGILDADPVLGSEMTAREEKKIAMAEKTFQKLEQSRNVQKKNTIPSSIADTALGLTTSELQILRQEQLLVAQGSHQAETASRGRGNSRNSQPNSRAASAASSQGGQGMVFLDPGSLQQLDAHFDYLLRRIQNRIDVLQEATENSVHASYDRAGNMMQNADAEIARLRRIISEIDALEVELDKTKHIRDVIKRLRQACESQSVHSHTHSQTGHTDVRGALWSSGDALNV